MRDIQFYIDNQIADFDNISQLPLKGTKTTDAFTELVGTGGLEIEQVFKTLSFPMTNQNCLIFKADMVGSEGVKGDTKYSYQCFVDGNKISSGSLRLKTLVKNGAGLGKFIAEVTDSSLSLWEQLESVSLNDLDLGAQVWSLPQITASWSDTVDDRNSIFVPIVYGKTTSTSLGAFHARDFRPSVYYIPIMKAIFQKVGYSIESGFFNTALMKNAVYAYSNGANLKRSEVVSDYQIIAQLNRIKQSDGSLIYSNIELVDGENQFDHTIAKFEPSTGGYFSFTMDCKCPYNFIINLKKNGTENNYYEVETGAAYPNTVTINVELLLELFDWIDIQLTTEFNLATGEAMEVDLTIDLKDTPVLGASLKLSSCLHNKPVKDFLRGVTHQFCGAWYVNERLKKVYFEPRFEGSYDILDGTTPTIERFDGFYSADTVPLEIEVTSIQIEMLKPFGNALVTGYAIDSNDPIEKHLKGDSSSLPFDTKVTFNDRNGKENTNRNPYFTTLYMGKVIAVISSMELPCILPSSFKVGEVLNGSVVDGQTKGEVTFDGSPKCGLVWREAVEIRIDGSSYVAPLLTQLTPYSVSHAIDNNYSMSYANFKKSGSTNEVRGLLSICHLKYMAIIRQAARLTCTALTYLNDFAQTDFRKQLIVEIGHTPTRFICTKIDDFDLYLGRTATYEAMAVTEPTQDDVDKTVQVKMVSYVVVDA